MYLLRNRVILDWKLTDCRRCMPWERVSSDNDMLNFMKKLIEIRKPASAIIQHGKYSLQGIKQDVVALEWKCDGQILKAIFNQSKKIIIYKRNSSTSKTIAKIRESSAISQKVCDFFH